MVGDRWKMSCIDEMGAEEKLSLLNGYIALKCSKNYQKMHFLFLRSIGKWTCVGEGIGEGFVEHLSAMKSLYEELFADTKDEALLHWMDFQQFPSLEEMLLRLEVAGMARDADGIWR